MPTPISYPLDLTGTASTNKITTEQHVATQFNDRNFYLIVPFYAPFFMNGLVVKRSLNGVTTTLVEGLDYYPAMPFIGATRAIGRPVYGALTLNNLNTAGIIQIDYQTLGGEWNLDQAYVLEQIAEKAYNPRLVSWEQIINAPVTFPPVPHSWDLVDLVGQSEVVAELHAIEQAILQKIGANQSTFGTLVNALGLTNDPDGADNPGAIYLPVDYIPKINGNTNQPEFGPNGGILYVPVFELFVVKADVNFTTTSVPDLTTATSQGFMISGNCVLTGTVTFNFGGTDFPVTRNFNTWTVSIPANTVTSAGSFIASVTSTVGTDVKTVTQTFTF